MPEVKDPNELMLALLKKLARDGVQHAVSGLSDMVGTELTHTEPEISMVPIFQVPNLVGGPENEVVGVYLLAEGQMSGQFMLILPTVKALEMVDLLMGDPPGTATELDRMARSALAEVGNLTGAYFLNHAAMITGLATLPSTPSVMFDMVGAILNIIVAAAAETVDEIVTIRTNIMQGNREVQAIFWYVPDLVAMEAIAKKASEG